MLSNNNKPIPASEVQSIFVILYAHKTVRRECHKVILEEEPVSELLPNGTAGSRFTRKAGGKEMYLIRY